MLVVALVVLSLAAVLIPESHDQRTSSHLADAADGELGLVPAAGAVPPIR
jgi:hypothetical protein